MNNSIASCNNCPNASHSVCCHQAMRPLRQPVAIPTSQPVSALSSEQFKQKWIADHGPSIFEELERRGEL